MTTYKFPDETSKGAPSMSIAAPTDWVRTYMADTAIALVREQDGRADSVGTPNLLIRYYERGLGVGPAQIVLEIAAMAEVVEKFAMREPAPAQLDGHAAFVVDTSYDMPETGTIVQRNVICMSATEFGSRILHATATVLATDAGHLMSEIDGVVASISLGDWP